MKTRSANKQKTRDLISEEASKSIRARGMDGVSIHQIMADAGLTVGGFYAHYKNKEALLGDAFDTALNERKSYLRENIRAEGTAEWLTDFLELYLTHEHRDDLPGGCPWAATLSDLGRTAPEVRASAEKGLRESLERFSRRAADSRRAGDALLTTMALAIGTLGLSRAVADEELGSRILQAGLTAGKAMAAALDQAT